MLSYDARFDKSRPWFRGLRAALFSWLLGACAGAQPASSEADASPSAPDFELESLDGESVRLSHHLGKDVIVLDFWATYCEPCLRALPELEILYRRHKTRGLLVLGVAIDGPDTVTAVRPLVSRLGVTFPILLDQETRAVALYNPKTSAPFSVLIGKDGHVIEKREGYAAGDAERLEQLVELALRKPPLKAAQ